MNNLPGNQLSAAAEMIFDNFDIKKKYGKDERISKNELYDSDDNIPLVQLCPGADLMTNKEAQKKMKKWIGFRRI